MEATKNLRKNGNSGEKLYKFFIYFVLIVLAITIIVPVAWVFMASIKQNSEFYGNPWSLPAGFYWQNFVDAWTKASMGDYMLNSVIVTALSLVILLVVALPASYCLSRFKFVTSKFLNTMFMAGLFINVNYIVVPIFLMLRDGDTWLKSVFGSGFLLNNLVVLSIVYAATALPFTIYLLSGYFATLAHDYEEAAYIDGAGYGRTMISIIFPMAQPSIVTIILFNFLSFWNEYIISMTLMSSATGAKTLPVGLLNLMQAQQSAADYGPQYAGLVMVMLPTLILYICVQKKLIQGMTVGGLKG
ncbi:MAG: carbohydrate ABC transporter permease [Oscillospiraceae bacterium]|jgi:N-acetylglucosamine transport system permease protein|nr:carbohydrate ABC transporter permease [Oscillospiraceae bacterium]